MPIKEYKEMTFNEYQQRAMSTCMNTCHNDAYMLLNLAAEVGELTGKVAKVLRHGEAWFEKDGNISYRVSDWEAYEKGLMGECGDVMWMLAGICEVMGWKMDDVAQGNIAKLASRANRGVIDGNGDFR